MHIVDKIQEPDLKIIRALYNDWKETNKGNLSFDADSCSLQSVVKGAGLPETKSNLIWRVYRALLLSNLTGTE